MVKDVRLDTFIFFPNFVSGEKVNLNTNIRIAAEAPNPEKTGIRFTRNQDCQSSLLLSIHIFQR
ncbi:hypothetical protein FMN12_04870 [Bacteroides acidifaciens]|uniref:Uncharacterized protein n=1 Tax=Bacteroides acidifaciens TaxID=85831 RepID=A0A7K3MFR1_9BACE|nr:hypothetical protein [Bacteroides acidifaciens]MBF0836422.1 hypothetical protein [Bacteroides acidifaciens]NDO53247.1 hypothetical protein [Bacteroides acidifaciens]TFU50953.1 hypothetical protein E4T97_06230 [Bacteroides acidifaciens]